MTTLSYQQPRTGRPLAWRTLLASGLGIGTIALTGAVELPIRLVWNASASVPIGLYVVRDDARIQRGVTVLVEPPEPLASFLADRGYLPRGVPLLKRVEALPGATVCRHDLVVSVDGEPRALARERDRFRRPLPIWSGCRTVAKDELFLLNVEADGSLDGRYFGPIPASSVVGRAAPLFIRNER